MSMYPASYSGDLQWSDWVNAMTQTANTVSNDIAQAFKWYQKWAALTYGLTAVQIQALPQFNSRTVADITAMMYAWGVFNDLYNALNNVSALTQANREGYLVPFLS